MTPKEIQELLDLKGWSQSRLADELLVNRASVHLWLKGDRNPRGLAVKVMRELLNEARAAAETVAAK